MSKLRILTLIVTLCTVTYGVYSFFWDPAWPGWIGLSLLFLTVALSFMTDDQRQRRDKPRG